MEQSATILEGYSSFEKGAYLGAIASIATADHSASEEEKEYLNALCESAGLTDEQTLLIGQVAAAQTTEEDLHRFLEVLKNSELRFSLISDLISFSESDQEYSEEEKHTVEKIAQYLGVNGEQFSVLDQFTKKAVAEAPVQAAALQAEQTTPQHFLNSLGFGDKLKKAGINSNALIKGALGIIGPILLVKMLSGRNKGAGLGGMMGTAGSGTMSGGGMLGGLGGLFSGGGLLGGLLGGGRGFSGAGGLLKRIFGANS